MIKSVVTEKKNIRGEEIEYESGGVRLKGYLAFDAQQEGPRPGVLVVHEWWGHNEYVRKRAHQLAQMGYTALAVDMYGDGKLADHPQDAMKFMQEVMSNMDSAEARFNAAKDLLAAHATTDGTRLAAIGYCFGGAVILHMARVGTDLAGVASFHGSLGTESPAGPGDITTEIFVAHGGSDPFIPAEQLEAFKSEMDSAQQDITLLVYPDAKHGFTDPGASEKGKRFELPLEYNSEADKDSWAKLGKFLERIFN
ncbi:MAG: dienelactone hydrolase family protein [Gammaproteobacteria bacterium]|nr:dienelactone hydrolase family protein [Gammaproteobacteria bacterium]